MYSLSKYALYSNSRGEIENCFDNLLWLLPDTDNHDENKSELLSDGIK